MELPGRPRTAPRISVVVPVFNRATVLEATVASVVAQDFEAWELVIVDDGSTDGSAELAKQIASHDDRITAVTYPNGGVANARNRGLALTDRRSEFVTFLDSDDLWFPDTLNVLLEAAVRHPEHVGAHGLPVCIDAAGERVPGDDLQELKRRRSAWSATGVVLLDPAAPTGFGSFLLQNWCVTPGTSLIRRAALERIGPFDPELAPADDWDLNVRLSRIAPLGFVDRPVLEWRQHDATLTNTSPKWRRAYHATRAKSVGDPANDDEQRRLAAGCYRREQIDAARRALTSTRNRHFGRAARESAQAALGWSYYLRAVGRARIARRGSPA